MHGSQFIYSLLFFSSLFGNQYHGLSMMEQKILYFLFWIITNHSIITNFFMCTYSFEVVKDGVHPNTPNPSQVGSNRKSLNGVEVIECCISLNRRERLTWQSRAYFLAIIMAAFLSLSDSNVKTQESPFLACQNKDFEAALPPLTPHSCPQKLLRPNDQQQLPSDGKEWKVTVSDVPALSQNKTLWSYLSILY